MKVIERYICVGRCWSSWPRCPGRWRSSGRRRCSPRIDLVTDSGQSALTFFEIAALILPSIIPIVMPFALVIGGGPDADGDEHRFGTGRDQCGRQLALATIRPVMLLAVAASVFSFAVDNGVDPYARQRGRELVAAARADLLSLVIQEGTFRKIEDGLFIQIGERLAGRPAGRHLRRRFARPKASTSSTTPRPAASSERDDKNVLVMNDGEIHRKLPGGDISVIRFTSYAFDLSAFSAAAGKPKLLSARTARSPICSTPIPTTPMFKQNAAIVSRRVAPAIHRMALSHCFRSDRAGGGRRRAVASRGRINPLVTAVTIALFVRWLGFFAANQSKSTPGSGRSSIRVPIGVAAIAIWFIPTNRTMELPVAWRTG